MNKLIAIAVVMMVMSGCASVQDKVSAYKTKRDAVASKVTKVHIKKECVKTCNDTFKIGLDRANCKATCAVKR